MSEILQIDIKKVLEIVMYKLINITSEVQYEEEFPVVCQKSFKEFYYNNNTITK